MDRNEVGRVLVICVFHNVNFASVGPRVDVLSDSPEGRPGGTAEWDVGDVENVNTVRVAVFGRDPYAVPALKRDGSGRDGHDKVTLLIDEREILSSSVGLGLVVDKAVGWVLVGEPVKVVEKVIALYHGTLRPCGGRDGGDQGGRQQNCCGDGV